MHGRGDRPTTRCVCLLHAWTGTQRSTRPPVSRKRICIQPTAEATAAAAAASPFKAVARLASSYVHPAAAAGGLLVSGTLLGRGLDHLLRAASSQLQTAGGTGSSSGGGGKDAIGGGSAAVVDADLLAALLVFALAAALDALDGHLARAYNQCSALGVVLDVVADIALRSALWIAAALLDPRWALPALGLITCEWLTLLASQVGGKGYVFIEWGHVCVCVFGGWLVRIRT